MFRDGQTPERPVVYPRTEQIEEDLIFVSKLTKRIRNYRTSGPFAEIPRLARKYGVSVAQGIHLGLDKRENENEILAALELAREGAIESLIVGNENLTAKSLSKAELLAYIERVKKNVPKQFPVGTAEVWSQWRDNPELGRAVDFVVAHFYPFWEDHSIVGAVEQLAANYNALRAKLQNENPGRTLRIVIGETGWPSGGRALAKNALPGSEQQRAFVERFFAFACGASIPFYYFSLFDEEWKWREGSSGGSLHARLPDDRTLSGRFVGSSWGLFQSDGTIKPHLASLLDQPPPGTRRNREIFVGGRLSSLYDVGLDTSNRKRDWLSTPQDGWKMSYPPGQDWGVVFVTVGTATPGIRQWKDFSAYDTLSLELKGETGNEAIELAVKDRNGPENGEERKAVIRNLGATYRTHRVRLTQFASNWLVLPDDLRELHVVIQFVFSGHRAQTVYVRNIRYEASGASAPVR